MGGGLSKSKSPTPDGNAPPNLNAFLKYLARKPPQQVNEAAVKIESSYRRVLAKKELQKLKEWRDKLESAALNYIEEMKDSKKVNKRKSILKTSAANINIRSSILRTSMTNINIRTSFYGGISFADDIKNGIGSPKFESSQAATNIDQGLSPNLSPSKQKLANPISGEEVPELEVSGRMTSKNMSSTSKSERHIASSSKKHLSSKRSKKFRVGGAARLKIGSSSKASGRNDQWDSEGDDVRSPKLSSPKGKNMQSVMESEEDEGFDSFEESWEEDIEGGDDFSEKIYPMIGYVAKSRFCTSQKKVFINVCHSASVSQIVCSPFREYIDASHYDDEGFIESLSVAICDVLVPSSEFFKTFTYQEGVGLVPKNATTAPSHAQKQKPLAVDDRAKLAARCISYLNTLSHCLDDKNPPIAGMLDPEEYMIDETYLRLPKTKKMYYGTLPLYYYNSREQILDFYQPLSWSYLLKQMPNTSDKNPLPETYFNHYFIDPFSSSSEAPKDGVVSSAAAVLSDSSKKRIFPPDIQYPMSLSYQCLSGDFDLKNPMKANLSALGGSTASSVRVPVTPSVSRAPVAVARSPKLKLSSLMTTRKRPFTTSDLNIDNDDEDDIPLHQKQYLESLSKLKTGYPVFMDLSFGVMSLYLTRATNNIEPNTSNSLPSHSFPKSSLPAAHAIDNNSAVKNNPSVPYGEKFIARIALCNYVLTTSYDATNHIFYLHFEAEHSAEDLQYNQFILSNYINEVSENIDLRQFTFQFAEYTELMTFQLLIERHIYYCNYCSSYTSSLLPSSSPFVSAPAPAPAPAPLERGSSFKENSATGSLERNSPMKDSGVSGRWQSPFSSVPATTTTTPFAAPSRSTIPYSYSQIKYDQVPITNHPSSRFFSFVERFSLHPLNRQKRFWKIDKGLVGVFQDDLKITPNWKNAIEIISLVNKRFEIISHRKIIRLRKFITKLHLTDEKTKRIREFFYKGEGESDQELQGIMTCIQQHIHYANSQYFRYQYHYIEALGILCKSTSAAPSDPLNVYGFDTQVQIVIPDPHTSDDDSDLEEHPNDEEEDDSKSVATSLPAPLSFLPQPPTSCLKTNQNPSFMHRNNTIARLNNPKVMYGSYFRVIHGKPNRDVSSRRESSSMLNNTTPEVGPENSDEGSNDEEGLPTTFEEIVDHWQLRLSEQYCSFSKSFFSCRIYYLEELDLMLLFQDHKLIYLMKISRVLEKPTLSSLNTSAATAATTVSLPNNLAIITSNILRRNTTPMKIINKPSPLQAQPTDRSLIILPAINTRHDSVSMLMKQSSKSIRVLNSTISSKLYDLDSDDDSDDSDSSDRDYMEEELVNDFSCYVAQKSTNNNQTSNGKDKDKETTISPSVWIFKVLSCDGRTYRFKFHQKQPYDKLIRFFLQKCVRPVLKHDISKEDSIQTVEPALPEIVFDNEATKKHARLLRVNERVIAAGTVLKHEKTLPLANPKDLASVPKQRRILLVTDSPRMIFVDTIGGVSRGHVELPADPKNEIKVIDGNDFEVFINGNLHRFTSAELPDKDAKYWTLKIRQAIAISK